MTLVMAIKATKIIKPYKKIEIAKITFLIVELDNQYREYWHQHLKFPLKH